VTVCSRYMTTAPTREHNPQGNEPLTTAEYLDPSYWDQRFEKEEQYDWFKDLSQFRHLLLPQLKRTDRILVLGCGNSSMTMALWREGFQNICSIDLSEVCLPTLVWRLKTSPLYPFLVLAYTLL